MKHTKNQFFILYLNEKKKQMAKLKFKKGYSDVGVFPLLSHVLKEGGLIVDDEDFELNPATSLTGEEKVKILQDGKTLLTTTQDIAALAGGGGASFIPNGIKIITESRELQADDAGYILNLKATSPESPVILTIPEICPIPDGGVFAVVNQVDAPSKNNGIINTTTEGAVLKPGGGEILVYAVTNPNFCVPISTIEKSNGAGEYKTALRYLMDIVGNTGTATLVAGTVTVANERVRTGAKIIVSVNTPGGTQGFLSAPSGSIVDETSFVINSSSATETSTVNYWFVNP